MLLLLPGGKQINIDFWLTCSPRTYYFRNIPQRKGKAGFNILLATYIYIHMNAGVSHACDKHTVVMTIKKKVTDITDQSLFLVHFTVLPASELYVLM